MSLVVELRKEKDALIKRIEAIDVLLVAYDASDEEFQDTEKKAIDSRLNVTSFPISGRVDKQLMWLFKHEITKGIKLGELQELYDKHKPTEPYKKISNVARRLKKESRLVIVQYNNMNKLSFWGLPEWIGAGDFKDEYKPDENLLPLSIETKSIITGE
jgi:hypothetical protein